MPINDWKIKSPNKFESLKKVFDHIRRGDTIFIGSACAEPQNLVQEMIRYVKSNPKAFTAGYKMGIVRINIA